MKVDQRLIAWALLALVSTHRAALADGKNLVLNADFEHAAAKARPDHFDIVGDAARVFAGSAYEFSSMGVALDAGRDSNGDGKREGAVSQNVPISATLPGRWFRFKIRGLPEDGFAVAGDHLHMKVDFYADHGKRALDGVTRNIYPIIEQERRDLTVNGVRRKGGAATWKSYAFEFRLPFPDIDQVRLSVGFRDGKGAGKNASFFVDDVSLVAIPAPTDGQVAAPIRPAQPSTVDASKLVALGGRWFYQPAAGETVATGGKGLVVTAENADRLLYREGGQRYLNPFAENMSAWLKKGYLDVEGNLVEKDELKPDNVTITCDASSLIVRAHNLPNHPTARFPSPPGSPVRNPNYIQEQDDTFRLPLKPEHNPNAQAMDLYNSNRALPMGPTGLAINGVVFFNPFDAGMSDATDLMDRCCGHPAPNNQYHYHKYPVCVKSPFADEGAAHSPLIGWALDGYAIYGPYESSGVMAKDSKERPLNAFNGHEDAERGWHYHVTPGKFPYIIGGYWGKLDPRARRGPGMTAGRGPGGPGPGGPGGPGFGPPRGGSTIMRTLDVDRDRELSPAELKNASTVLKRLDLNNDGELTPDELPPQDGPGGPPRDED